MKRAVLAASVVLAVLVTGIVFGAEEPPTPSEKAGQKAYREGRFAAAVQLYTTALAETQDAEHRARLHVRIAWTDFALGKENEARTHLKAALMEDPGLTLVPDYYTSDFLKLFDRAREELARRSAQSSEVPPPDLESTLAGVQQRLEQGDDLEGALADVEQLIQVYPSDPRLLPLRSQILAKLGRDPNEPLPQASAGETAAVPVPGPESPAPAVSVADLVLQANGLLQDGDVDRALPLLRQAVERQPSNVAALDLLAEAAQRAGLWHEAELALKSALGYQRDNIELELRLGEVYLAMGKRSSARDVFRGILERHPHSDRAWAALGLLEGELGKHEDALEKLERALEENPLLPQAQLAYGELLLLEGKPADALAAFRNAENLLENDAQTEARTGQALLALGKPAEALPKLEAGIHGGFEHQDVLRARVLALIETGNLAEARRALASEKLEHGPDVTLLEGRLDLASGDAAAALEQFQSVAKERPNDPRVLNLVGVALYRLGRYADSVSIFQHASELAPDSEAITRNLQLARTAQAAVDLANRALTVPASKPGS